jgi:hypothetical protein
MEPYPSGQFRFLTTRTTNLATVRFAHGPGPELTVRNRCSHSATIAQGRQGGGVQTWDCRDDGTPSLGGIPPTSRYENESHSRRKLSQTIHKASNNL